MSIYQGTANTHMHAHTHASAQKCTHTCMHAGMRAHNHTHQNRQSNIRPRTNVDRFWIAVLTWWLRTSLMCGIVSLKCGILCIIHLRHIDVSLMRSISIHYSCAAYHVCSCVSHLCITDARCIYKSWRTRAAVPSSAMSVGLGGGAATSSAGSANPFAPADYRMLSALMAATSAGSLQPSQLGSGQGAS